MLSLLIIILPGLVFMSYVVKQFHKQLFKASFKGIIILKFLTKVLFRQVCSYCSSKFFIAQNWNEKVKLQIFLFLMGVIFWVIICHLMIAIECNMQVLTFFSFVSFMLLLDLQVKLAVTKIIIYWRFYLPEAILLVTNTYKHNA